jgi:NCAIR mutase (PurE)-related protein
VLLPAGTVAIISAGTADELVAEECRATADVMGCYCFRLADVSVDGLHRILHNLPGERPQVCPVHTPQPLGGSDFSSLQQAGLMPDFLGQDQHTIWAGAVACQAQVFTSPRPLCAHIAAVRAADVIVVVAGTDGALPSVVAGLVEAPVIAVPTSVGYGAALQVPRQSPASSNLI